VRSLWETSLLTAMRCFDLRDSNLGSYKESWQVGGLIGSVPENEPFLEH